MPVPRMGEIVPDKLLGLLLFVGASRLGTSALSVVFFARCFYCSVSALRRACLSFHERSSHSLDYRTLGRQRPFVVRARTDAGVVRPPEPVVGNHLDVRRTLHSA